MCPYQARRGHVRANNDVANKRHHEENRRYLNKYKASRPCMDCGLFFPPYVMEFDHRDPADKLDKVSRLVHYKFSRMLAEIAKCDLVCANCHRTRTFNNRPDIYGLCTNEEGSNMSRAQEVKGKSLNKSMGLEDQFGSAPGHHS